MTMRSRMMRTAAARLAVACVAAAGLLACVPLPCAAADRPAAVVGTAQAAVSATGGDAVNDVGGYRVHTYTNVGTSTFSVKDGGDVEVLVVAGGGGGGGGNQGGGGGAGGLRIVKRNLPAGTYTITVGAGGKGCDQRGRTVASNGQSSSISFGGEIVTTTGGGRGGSESPDAAPTVGGSGGGGCWPSTTLVADGTPGEGNKGGKAGHTSGGGGGGAGSAGSDDGGPGGAGINLTFSGVPVTYAAGGNGSSRNSPVTGVSGPNNTGTGGGGTVNTSSNAGVGGAGGSGIVIVRYLHAAEFPLIATEVATDVQCDSASLNGNLIGVGLAPTTVRVYWGTKDLYPSTTGWEGSHDFGVVGAPKPLTYPATKFAAPTGYVYRYYATNSKGERWGNPVAFHRPAALKEILELTGGKRLRVVWNEGADWGPEIKVKYYDSKTGVIEDLPIDAAWEPKLSSDGRRVFASSGKTGSERSLVVCDLETKKVKQLSKGLGNNLLDVWMDPKSGKEWVYVNSMGDKNENWQVANNEGVYRFPVDKPEDRELFWDRTSSHEWLMFSADGTKACFEPSWENIGLLSIAYGPDGKIDQDKSDYKPYGGGCFPGLAPDNSYRLYRLDGPHRTITMNDAGGGNARQIDVSVMPGVKEVKDAKIWLPRWSTHPRFMTCMAPDSPRARIWLLRFDEGFTRIEGAVPVRNEGAPKCWSSHAWIDSGEEKKAEKPGKPAVKAEKPAKKPASED